ncbi:hypothetical protein PI124_g2710 [Phytophthora idaei]|nr:hypothetical protein PI125_g17413 [Phytophthora idaei]KAG3135038.1 hypothetical protein PI126_g18424 [Phytophthora idaei]KAG3252675.1 hypothetical protein PI124_g2710 [Phytophthora idaei]
MNNGIVSELEMTSTARVLDLQPVFNCDAGELAIFKAQKLDDT